jgi:hypothetical protein
MLLQFLTKFLSSSFTQSIRTSILTLVSTVADNFSAPLINSDPQKWDLPNVVEQVNCT